jgi:hypothetical protein
MKRPQEQRPRVGGGRGGADETVDDARTVVIPLSTAQRLGQQRRLSRAACTDDDEWSRVVAPQVGGDARQLVLPAHEDATPIFGERAVGSPLVVEGPVSRDALDGWCASRDRCRVPDLLENRGRQGLAHVAGQLIGDRWSAVPFAGPIVPRTRCKAARRRRRPSTSSAAPGRSRRSPGSGRLCSPWPDPGARRWGRARSRRRGPRARPCRGRRGGSPARWRRQLYFGSCWYSVSFAALARIA